MDKGATPEPCRGLPQVIFPEVFKSPVRLHRRWQNDSPLLALRRGAGWGGGGSAAHTHTHTYTHTLSLSLTHTLSFSLTHSLSLSLSPILSLERILYTQDSQGQVLALA